MTSSYERSARTNPPIIPIAPVTSRLRHNLTQANTQKRYYQSLRDAVSQGYQWSDDHAIFRVYSAVKALIGPGFKAPECPTIEAVENRTDGSIYSPTLRFSCIITPSSPILKFYNKELILHTGFRFPYPHDLTLLLTLVEKSNLNVPDNVKFAGALTDYAVKTRYPGLSGPVTENECHEVVQLAGKVVIYTVTLNLY